MLVKDGGRVVLELRGRFVLPGRFRESIMRWFGMGLGKWLMVNRSTCVGGASTGNVDFTLAAQ